MSSELESLVRKLDRKVLVDWVEEMRLGKLAYEDLLARIRNGTLNRNQTANALHVLFRLRTHGSEEDLFTVLRSHARHRERRVRDEAVKLLIGMVKLHDFKAPFQPNICINEIKMGLTDGLNHDVAALAQDFVARYGRP
jgi:hypothetical protein